MAYSKEYNVLFLGIAKAGSTSIIESLGLKKFGPPGNGIVIDVQHVVPSQIFEYKFLTREEFDSFFKFTFVRNPWDRIYSDWVNLWSKQCVGGFSTFLEGVEKVVHKFETEKSYTLKNLWGLHNPGPGFHLLPQHLSIIYEGQRVVDFIGRFENFDENIKTFFTMADIPDHVKMKHISHGNKNKKDYREFYTKKDRDKVAQIYKKDIELLNYKFE